MLDLTPLRRLSARIGADLNLVQAGGGNTSIKDRATLWVKASGKWLVDAEKEEMFLPVEIAAYLRSIEESRDYVAGFAALGDHALRPSVETAMHAVMPHRVVVHVHSVNTIAWAIRVDAAAALAAPLAGLRWAWIPYVHPGLILGQRIAETSGSKPDVLVLGNHGLVIGAEDCEEAEEMLNDVERRLARVLRPVPAHGVLPNIDGWQPAPDLEVHSLAMDSFGVGAAAGGTMYPDHCVYLGPSVAATGADESPIDAVARYRSQHGVAPKVLVVQGAGVMVPEGLSRAGRAMLICLKRVVERIDRSAPFGYLDAVEVARLMNWDAEKYRIGLARQYEA